MAQEGLTIAQELVSPRHVSRLRLELGVVALWRGDLAQARALIEAGLAEARQAEQWTFAAEGAIWLARALLLHGDASVRRRCVDSLDLYSALRLPRGVGQARQVLALTQWHRGEATIATTCLTESLRLWRQTGERSAIAECLEGLAMVAAGGGRPSARRAAARRGGGGAAGAGRPRPPAEQPGHEALVRRVEAALGGPAFTRPGLPGRR